MATRKATKKEEEEIEELEEEEAAEEEEEEEDEDPTVEEPELPSAPAVQAPQFVPRYVSISYMSKSLKQYADDIANTNFKEAFGDDKQMAQANLAALVNVLDVLALLPSVYIPVSPTLPALNPG